MTTEEITQAVQDFLESLGLRPEDVASIEISHQRLKIRKILRDAEGRARLDHMGSAKTGVDEFWFPSLNKHD